jgi:hypothetical protein
MKIKSVLKPKQVAWISGVLLAVILGVAGSRSLCFTRSWLLMMTRPKLAGRFACQSS